MAEYMTPTVMSYVLHHGAREPFVEKAKPPHRLKHVTDAYWNITAPDNMRLRRANGTHIPIELILIGYDEPTDVHHWTTPTGPVNMWPGDILQTDHWPQGTAVYVRFHHPR